MSKLPMRHYCTYFDRNYLARGLVLHESLEEHSEGDFRLYVLCLDETTEEILCSLGKETIVPIPLAKVEEWDPELLKAKANRSTVEYYFTLSPILPLYVLKNFGCDLVTYLDADLMFFSSPEAIFTELGDRSILITEHRFPPHLKSREIYGRFNVQCQVFRNDSIGLKCLERWRKQCLDWCYDRLEEGKFADQKYLDEWPELYGRFLKINEHPGIGLAPWNVLGHVLQQHHDSWLVDGNNLIFYHFHGIRKVVFRLIKTSLSEYGAPMNRQLKNLYSIYMRSFREKERFVGHSNVHDINKRSDVGKIKILYSGVKGHDLFWL
ncbi:MAG: hypothetical protein D6704_01125 [Nitrospirae bacterium]|nr:MAG: hypothetical protein D6704_01125 [Nitrospirota bacterium]